MPDPELTALRTAILERGHPDVPAAERTVERYLAGILAEAGVSGHAAAHRWARDRLRLFLVVSLGNWFGVLERLPREYPALRAEWRALVADAQGSGPEDLIAWWWHLRPPMFEPLVAAALREMSVPLRDGVAAVLCDGGDFDDRLVDWPAFGAAQ